MVLENDAVQTVKKKAKTPHPSKGRHYLDSRVDEIIARDDGDDDSLLTTEAIAELWHLSPKWFETGRKMGYGPEFVIIEPHAVRYPRDKARAWLRKRLKTPGQRKLVEA